jgi:hypothetical protein
MLRKRLLVTPTGLKLNGPLMRKLKVVRGNRATALGQVLAVRYIRRR